MKMVLLSVGILLTINSNSQPTEYQTQVFGNNCYLEFPAGNNITGSASTTTEGCASICDAAGNLIFYSNGVKVWNRLNLQMPNGFGLLGNISTSQSCIIVKKPGSNTLYYLFTAPETGTADPVTYSIIDMSLNAGLGDLILKNQLLPGASITSTEKLTFTYHCNQEDVWVVTKDKNNNVFKSWLLSFSGLNFWSFSISGYTPTSNGIGCMKISKDGSKLALCHYGDNRVYLYDFNNQTGVVSNEKLLSSNIIGPYGLEFSANSEYLYVGYNSGANIHSYLVNNINPSLTRTSVVSNIGPFVGQFQLIGNDIYISQRNINFLHCITNADFGGVYNQNYLPVINAPQFGLNQILYRNLTLPIITTN